MTDKSSYIGKQFGNYRIVTEISNGAFGRVYQGQHIILTERSVAIKLLHATYLGSQQEHDSFLQEAQFLEKLKHPHILSILDVGIHEGLPYLVAEYAPNGSLHNRLKRQNQRPLPLQEALTIISQIGQALQFAHAQNIIHRDLKPENILFNAKGDALLADFGIAIVLATSSVRHVDSTGTPAYMAPEQFRGMVSKESDQYALGCIAYELFTGHQPFSAPDFVAMGFMHATETPIAPTNHNPQLSIHIEQAILKAMAKQRADRHTDISAFIKALNAHSDADLPTIPTSNTATILQTTASNETEKAKKQWLDEGNFHYEANRYEEALTAFEQAIQLDPNNTYAWHNKGLILWKLNRNAEALAISEHTIQLDPNFANAYHIKGIVLYNLKRYEEAITAYEQALRFDSNNAIYYVDIGNALCGLKRYREALVVLEHASQLDANYPVGWRRKGFTLRMLNRNEEALGAYEQAIRLDPRYADAYLGKGHALSRLKRYTEAFLVYEQAIHLDPHNAASYNSKGNVLSNLKRYQEALTAYGQAIQLNPNNAVYQNNKGNMLYEIERYEEALDAYEQAARLLPGNAIYHYNKGGALLHLKRYQEALIAYERAIQLNHNYANAWHYKGDVLKRLGRSKAAHTAHEKARQLGYSL